METKKDENTKIDENTVDTTEELKKKINRYGKIIKQGFIDPKELTKAETNIRKTQLSNAEKKAMDESITQFGVVYPVIINTNYEVVLGSLRWASALRTLQEEVPYIMMEFKNRNYERSAGILEEETNHPLDMKDKAGYVVDSMNDNYDYKDMSEATGKDISTLILWSQQSFVPEVISDDEECVNIFKEQSDEKQKLITDVLSKPGFRDSPEEAKEYVRYAGKADAKDLVEDKKKVNEGIKINVKAKKEKQKEGTKLKTVSVKIPHDLYMKFLKKLQDKNKDMTVVLEKLIREYVRYA